MKIVTGSSSIVKPEYSYGDLKEAFPEVNPGLVPFGSRVLVQIRSPKTRTKSGLYVPEETRQTELWNTQVAKVIALGPVAFKNRDTLESWKEGAWCEVGHFVRCPKYGGDRWQVPISDSASALFVLFNDLDIIGQVTINPLDVVAFL